MRRATIRKSLISVVLALTCLRAAEGRQATKFTGKSIPDPPRQKEPWTPPRTRLPRFLVTATAALFEQGVADPRGCEYREVEIADGAPARIRGFVLPAQAGERDRFVVSWDGVIYPALAFGAAADMEKDVRGEIESLRRSRLADPEGPNRRELDGRRASPFARGSVYQWAGPGKIAPTALRIPMLLRLGRADLAEAMFAAATTWTPDAGPRDLTDYGVSYLTMAQDWASIMFLRLIAAHMRGDDAIAIDAARRLSAFAPAAEARAQALGFEKARNRFSEEPPSYFPFLRQLPEILADQERRAKEPPRGPVPPHGADPAARVAGLIRELDQIAERQMVHFGNSPNGSPLVRALIVEGDAAVEPLLAAVESDTRLTRTTTRGRDITAVDYYVHPVVEVEVVALAALLKDGPFANAEYRVRNDMAARKELARSMRDYWIKNRAIPMTERWYRTLRDDAAGSEWLGAASMIVAPVDEPRRAMFGARITPATGPMQGEALRSRRDPSVSELMARRALETARAPGPRATSEPQLQNAAELALRLARWDLRAAPPVLRNVANQARRAIEWNHAHNYHQDQGLEEFLATSAVIEARAGERAGLDAYAADIRKDDPREQHLRVLRFEPMWTFPDDPAIRDAAHWLFNDPASPWSAFIRAPGREALGYFFQDTSLYTSPLLGSAGFREAVIAAVANKSPMGTVRRNQDRTVQWETDFGNSGGFEAAEADLEGIPVGEARTFRACDYIAWQVSTIEGAPRCELYWPADQRDDAVAACAAYLKTYGARLTIDAPGDEPDPPHQKRAHLAFPALDRPATREDVRAARAIFSMEGEGEVRRAKVPGLPIEARWLTLKDLPIDRPGPGGGVIHDFDQGGRIWQAEEVRQGDHWERSYGFVGRHAIARVPAAEIEQAPGRGNAAWGQLTGGLDVRIDPVDQPHRAAEPGRPIVVVVRIRNRRGVENRAPAEFLRRGADGRLALRRGLTLTAYYSAPRRNNTDMIFEIPNEELKPKRIDRFDPGADARPMAPFEVREAMRLDLNDWFDLTRRGQYRVVIEFGADSGAGAGTSNNWFFEVGESLVP